MKITPTHLTHTSNSMGSKESTCCGKCQPDDKNKKNDWGLSAFEQSIKDRIALQAMAQREVQLSVSMAQARDNLLVFGSAWTCLLTGVTTAKLLGKTVPPFAAVPVLVGGVMLGNIYDFAYGTKLQRVVSEAEFIMEHESHRFVPPKQAPFHKNYSQDQLQKVSSISAVSTHVPGFLPWSRP